MSLDIIELEISLDFSFQIHLGFNFFPYFQTSSRILQNWVRFNPKNIELNVLSHDKIPESASRGNVFFSSFNYPTFLSDTQDQLQEQGGFYFIAATRLKLRNEQLLTMRDGKMRAEELGQRQGLGHSFMGANERIKKFLPLVSLISIQVHLQNGNKAIFHNQLAL